MCCGELNSCTIINIIYKVQEKKDKPSVRKALILLVQFFCLTNLIAELQEI